MPVRARPSRLVLFFTRGVSLAEWDRLGMFDREVALYRALARRDVRTTFVTHGGPEDLAYRDRLGDAGIGIGCDRRRLGRGRYERLLPLLAAPALLRCDLVKTNQINGGELAARAARLYRRPLIARCGYMWSEFVEREHGADSSEARRAREIEARVFRAGARVVVTTSAMRDAVAARFPEIAPRLRVVPNYVDTESFSPADGPPPRPPAFPASAVLPASLASAASAGEDERFDVLFVGRIAPQKNLESLLEAFVRLAVARPDAPLRIAIAGDGPDRDSLRARFESEIAPRIPASPLARERHGGPIAWLGPVPNATLPNLMRRSSVFCLPSHYEGHPKALLEAMACGMAVVAADAPGLREVIRHEETGLVVPGTAESLAESLDRLLRDAPLRARLGAAARAHAVEHWSLDRIVDLELGVYEEALAARRADMRVG